MVAAKAEKSAEIIVKPFKTETITLAVLGETPIILNRLAEKARRTILFPPGTKTAAERQATLKHTPVEEFRSSPHKLVGEDSPTLLAIPSGAIKGALMTAALDMPGAKKAQIGRLVRVMGEFIPIYGVPKLFMSVVRSADMNRTPDIRTRAIIREWVALVTIKYATPLLTQKTIVNLLMGAGETCGVGDWRTEKGKGTYGSFRLGDPDAPDFQRIMREGGRAAQVAAMEEAEAYDADSEELLTWFKEELVARGREPSAEEAPSEEVVSEDDE